ncbi:MAG: hypothetical protein ACTSPG_05455 [Candidatus Hodarchaeales archaeon]
MNIEEIAFWTEIVTIPLIDIICIFSTIQIVKKNINCKINLYVAIGLLFATFGTWGTIIRAIVFRFSDLSYMSEFGIITRHIDAYLIFYSVYSFYCAFWLLFQEPETPLLPKIKIILIPITILMILDICWGSWINSLSSHIFALLSILLTLFFLFLSLDLFHKMVDKVPQSKKRRIYLLAKGVIFIGTGFIFIIVGGSVRAFGLTHQLLPLVYITQSFLSWIAWLIGTSYFYRGIPTREAYFFDELNQILVYELNLPIGTNLDKIFELFEKNIDQTRQIMKNELKQRDSISDYIKEISREYVEKK